MGRRKKLTKAEKEKRRQKKEGREERKLERSNQRAEAKILLEEMNKAAVEEKLSRRIAHYNWGGYDDEGKPLPYIAWTIKKDDIYFTSRSFPVGSVAITTPDFSQENPRTADPILYGPFGSLEEGFAFASKDLNVACFRRICHSNPKWIGPTLEEFRAENT